MSRELVIPGEESSEGDVRFLRIEMSVSGLRLEISTPEGVASIYLGTEQERALRAFLQDWS